MVKLLSTWRSTVCKFVTTAQLFRLDPKTAKKIVLLYLNILFQSNRTLFTISMWKNRVYV